MNSEIGTFALYYNSGVVWVLKINNVAKIVDLIRARALNQSLLDFDLQSTSVSITAGFSFLLSNSPLSFVFRKLKDIQLCSFQAFHDPDGWEPTQTYWLNSDTVLAHFTFSFTLTSSSEARPSTMALVSPWPLEKINCPPLIWNVNVTAVTEIQHKTEPFKNELSSKSLRFCILCENIFWIRGWIWDNDFAECVILWEEETD